MYCTLYSRVYSTLYTVQYITIFNSVLRYSFDCIARHSRRRAVALQAGVLGAVCLASRLQSAAHATALLTLAFVLFSRTPGANLPVSTLRPAFCSTQYTLCSIVDIVAIREYFD